MKKFINSFNFVKKKITEVTQTAVNNAVNLLEDNQSGDYLKDLYLALRSKQLYIDKETYNNNFPLISKIRKTDLKKREQEFIQDLIDNTGISKI